jgi:hypothetical protein
MLSLYLFLTRLQQSCADAAALLPWVLLLAVEHIFFRRGQIAGVRKQFGVRGDARAAQWCLDPLSAELVSAELVPGCVRATQHAGSLARQIAVVACPTPARKEHSSAHCVAAQLGTDGQLVVAAAVRALGQLSHPVRKLVAKLVAAEAAVMKDIADLCIRDRGQDRRLFRKSLVIHRDTMPTSSRSRRLAAHI